MQNDPSTAPEGASRPVRRRFSEREKLRILDAADACTRPGEIGLLVRREGIYTSHLANWRRWRIIDWMGGMHFEFMRCDMLMAFFRSRGLELMKGVPTSRIVCHELVLTKTGSTGHT